MPTTIEKVKMLTRREAAERLGVEPQTLAVWAHYRRGPAFIKVGRSVPIAAAILKRSSRAGGSRRGTKSDNGGAPRGRDGPRT